MDVLDTDCLKLNSNWTPIAVVTVRRAFEDAAAEAATLLRFEDGFPIPFRLPEWLNIPVQDHEEFVGVSGRFHQIRKVAVPRVMISVNFNKIITKEQRPQLDNVLKRYGHKDAVTGQHLAREDASLEHVRPRSKGGDSTWKNVVPMHKKLNSQRGNKSYRKIGLKTPKILSEPKPFLPINTIINRYGYVEWDLFKIPR